MSVYPHEHSDDMDGCIAPDTALGEGYVSIKVRNYSLVGVPEKHPPAFAVAGAGTIGKETEVRVYAQPPYFGDEG